MSAADCTQPSVQPPHDVLEPDIDGSLPVTLQSSEPIGGSGDCPITEEDVASTSLLVDVDAKGATSSPSPPLLDTSPNPPGITPQLSDTSIEPGPLGPADNLDIFMEQSISRLFPNPNDEVDASSAHQDIDLNVTLKGLKPAAARAARQTIAEEMSRLKDILDQIEEILPFLGPTEPASAYGASRPSLTPSEAPGGAEVQNIVKPIVKPIDSGIAQTQRLVRDVLELLIMKCFLIAIKMLRYDRKLRKVEGDK